MLRSTTYFFFAALWLSCATAAASPTVIKKGDNFNVSAETKLDSLKGTLVIVIEPNSGFKVDPEKGPADVTFDPPAGVTFEKKAWTKADGKFEGTQRLRFEVPFGLQKPGAHKLKIAFRFVLCNDTICQMKRFEVEYALST